MHRGRIILASIAILSLVPSLIGVPAPARAGGFVGTAHSDFTQVTPSDVIYYGALQDTSANQSVNLKTIGHALVAHVNARALLQQALGTSAGDLSSAELVINQVVGSLQKIFDGELGLAILPVSVTARSHGAPAVTLHMLLDAGLQSGTTFGQLNTELALLGSSIVKQAPAYRNLPVVELDLRSLIATVSRSAGGGRAQTARVGSSPVIAGIFYAAVAGNIAVLATDMSTLRHSIDTYFGAAPSLSGVYDFQQSMSALPADRLYTGYVHVDTEQWRPLVKALATNPSARAWRTAFPAQPGTLSDAYSVSAEPDGILTTSSPRVAVGSLSSSLGLTATGLTEPSFLPADTLAYAGLNDPGTLIRDLLIGAYAGAMAAQKNPHLQPGDLNVTQILANGDTIIKKIDQQIGINLDDRVFSWMHGDASIALLPAGSRDFGKSSPTNSLSVVATLRITDQATVQADLAFIKLALQAIPNSGLQGLQFVEVPTSSSNPLEMLAATPTGIGYTFYHGYLIVASALPADFAGIVKASAGGSLAANPTYKKAFVYFPNRPYGAAFYANLTGLRETIEKLARATGADMRDYNRQVRPILLSFKSVSAVSFAGPTGGGAQFIGISS